MSESVTDFGHTKTGRPRVSAYYADIGPSPECAAGDHAAALAYLHKIEQAIVKGGWTAWENIRLKKLRLLWERRAFGRDPRFDAVGTRDGRLPADVEHALRPKMTKQREEEKRTKRRGRLQDQRSNPERRWVNADLPVRPAKGAGVTVDPEVDVFEPESGDCTLPVIPPSRQYLIPGQDTKGHSHRVYCRVMPAHYRALCAIERSKTFGFRTIGDAIRWCIDHGVRELTARGNLPQARSALAQVDAIREILLDEQYYLEFPQTFELMATVINKHLSAGAETEAVRLIAMVRHQIEQMGEDYWREKFYAELMQRYGNYLDGTRTQGASFGGDA